MKPIDLGPVDLAELREHARAAVKDKAAWDALVSFVTLSQPIALERLRERANEQLQTAPLAAWMDATRITRSGQVTDHRPAADDPSDEESTTARMHEALAYYHHVLAMGGIVAGLQQLQFDHGLAEPDFFYLASRSAFVPHGREPYFARGLAAGAAGDFVTAAHLLVPQFEHAIRIQLNQLGVSTLTLPASGVQNEIDLSALLDKAELRTLYDEATIFDWKSLLTEKAGANLRNELAHGLVEPGDRQAEQIYLWWMILRCVVARIFVAAPSSQSGK
jgi:hypothetical protein